MSWLFGVKPPGEDIGFPIPPSERPPDDSAAKKGDGSGNPDNSGGESGVDSQFRFDSRALERAAKAAKELEASKFAPQAYELSKMQEETKQLDIKKQMKEYDTVIENSKVQQARVMEEERRKTMQEQSKHSKNRAEYEDQLARKREAEILAMQQRNEDERLRKQEESVKKQEAMRKATIEQEMKMRSQLEMERIKAEKDAQGKLERENQDLALERLRAKMNEQRITILEAIKTSSTVVGSGIYAFVTEPGTMLRTVGGVALLAGAIYSAKQGTGVLARFVEARLGKPSLVRETSRVGPVDLLKHPIQPKLEHRLYDIALTTKNTKNNKGFFRNVMFYGPPGTGKTLFAKRLAATSGIDFAILTGGDVAPLGRDGVSAIHKVFDWAQSSRKGLLLFVDEADAFLRKRSVEAISEDMRSTLNAFLYRTGEQSKKFMLVLATNQPEQFDWAINDRVDEMVNFSLPGLDERKRMLLYYFQLFIAEPATKGIGKRLKIDKDFDWVKKCNEIAKIGVGLSGREISKLVVSWQASAYASENGVLTEEMIDQRMVDAMKQHEQKMDWLRNELNLPTSRLSKSMASISYETLSRPDSLNSEDDVKR